MDASETKLFSLLQGIGKIVGQKDLQLNLLLNKTMWQTLYNEGKILGKLEILNSPVISFKGMEKGTKTAVSLKEARRIQGLSNVLYQT